MHMKRLFFLLLAHIIILHASAQYRVEVNTGEKRMSKGDQTAFTVMIPDSKRAEVEAMWKKHVNVRAAGERISNLNTQIGNIFKSKDNRSKRDPLKMVRNGEELYVRAVEIDEITNVPLDVYTYLNQLPEGTELSVFFQYTDSVFLNESTVDEDQFASIMDYVRNFGVEAYKTVVNNNIKLASKEVTKEQNRLKDLQASTLREEKSILRNEAAIQEFKERIIQLKNDSAGMIEPIDLKAEELAELHKDSAEYLIVEKELKELQREKSRYSREIRILKTKIKSKELDIQSARNQIAENELEVENQTKVIENKQQIAEQLIREKGQIE